MRVKIIGVIFFIALFYGICLFFDLAPDTSKRYLIYEKYDIEHRTLLVKDATVKKGEVCLFWKTQPVTRHYFRRTRKRTIKDTKTGQTIPFIGDLKFERVKGLYQ